MIHSHPGSEAWQSLSGPDADAESSFANLVREITGLPLIGMTLAGKSLTWSARHWDIGVGRDIKPTHCDNVRVIGDSLAVSWNDTRRPISAPTDRQIRTISSWGNDVHESITRLRILVVGLGSVGLDVAVRLAASGFREVGLMDFDIVENRNLDRLIGALASDVRLQRRKIDVASRLMRAASSASSISIDMAGASICEPAGLEIALDYDVILSCVDRPWPRAVLNALAYSDLIPVIDAGIAIDTFEDGSMRNATWRSHVVRPGRPCMTCAQQLEPGDVALDVEGLLDDPTYVTTMHRDDGQNVAVLCGSVSGALLTQMVSLLIAPGGLGDPGPLQYLLSTHTLEHLSYLSKSTCLVEENIGVGDARVDLTGRDWRAEKMRRLWESPPMRLRALRLIGHLSDVLLGHR